MKINRIYLKIALASVLAAGAVSCDLNKYPDNAINTDESMESAADCQSFLNGLYSGMKYCFTGTSETSAETSTATMSLPETALRMMYGMESMAI